MTRAYLGAGGGNGSASADERFLTTVVQTLPSFRFFNHPHENTDVAVVA